ncbi:MAG TPA: hypothetical protein VNW95_04940 [Mucilaginibacter sp.]|nr:hypothetical protein [Mucilaginibacter sp.]
MKTLRYWFAFKPFRAKLMRKLIVPVAVPPGRKIAIRRKHSRTAGNLSIYNTNQLFL